MHDPLTLAFSIRRPWPGVRRSHGSNPPRFRVGLRAFWNVGPYELYFPAVVSVWHHEPEGRDSGTVCRYDTRWQWHVHHWRVRFDSLQLLRRRLLTRCEWCGGPSRRGDMVNVSRGGRARSPWWKGERDLFHGDCLSIDSAHRTCTCALAEGGPWEHDNYGQCATCNRFRPWRAQHDARPHFRTTRILQTIPVGQRDPEKLATVRSIWREYREQAGSHG